MAISPAASGRRRCLVVAVQLDLDRTVWRRALHRAAVEHDVLDVLIPAVLPPTLPLSAAPPALCARLAVLERVALDQRAVRRVDVVHTRDLAALVLERTTRTPAAEVVLVGPRSRRLRRALDGAAGVGIAGRPPAGEVVGVPVEHGALT